MGEHMTEDHGVVGSIPTQPISSLKTFINKNNELYHGEEKKECGKNTSKN